MRRLAIDLINFRYGPDEKFAQKYHGEIAPCSPAVVDFGAISTGSESQASSPPAGDGLHIVGVRREMKRGGEMQTYFSISAP
jgi:hypothetical protein